LVPRSISFSFLNFFLNNSYIRAPHRTLSVLPAYFKLSGLKINLPLSTGLAILHGKLTEYYCPSQPDYAPSALYSSCTSDDLGISAWGALVRRQLPTATPFIRRLLLLSEIHKTEALAGSIFPRKLWPYCAITEAITEISTIHNAANWEKRAARKPRSLVY